METSRSFDDNFTEIGDLKGWKRILNHRPCAYSQDRLHLPQTLGLFKDTNRVHLTWFLWSDCRPGG